MAWINSSTTQQALNPHAPEFRPSATVPPPSPFQPHHFIHPYLLYQEYSLLISHPTPPPPYTFTHPNFVFSSFHYLNSSPGPAATPPPPPPPQPPTPPKQPVVGTSWRYNNSDRRQRGNYMIRRRNTINYSRPTRTFAERDYHDINHNNYNNHHRKRSSISKAANLFVRNIQLAPVPVNQGGHETTVMIRNIPNDFTRKMLIRFLDDFCNRENNKNQDADGGDQDAVEFDFVYLPIDFGTKMNKGYAFVNFTTPNGLWRLQEANMKDQTWGFGDSIKKRREIALAKIQGKNALIKHFEQSRFVCESEEYLPVSFSPARDGSSESKMKQVSQRNIGHRLQQTTTASRKKPFLRYANN